MPILTEQIYTINKIKKMDVSLDEKIKLLKEIGPGPYASGCRSCYESHKMAGSMINQMVDHEIKKLKEKYAEA